MTTIERAAREVDLAQRAYIYSTGDLGELDTAFGELSRKRTKLNALIEVDAILRGIARDRREEKPVRSITHHERIGLLDVLIRAHRAVEDYTLELGEYLGFWDIIEMEDGRHVAD